MDSLPYRMKDFYERMGSERATVLERVPALFAPDVHFINPVVDHRGLEAFLHVWRRALRLYKTFECENVEVSGTDAHFFLSYTMHIRFVVGPTLHIPMSTECRAKDGKVTQCRDYFDPMGALAATAAPAKQVYRRVIGLLVA